MRYTDFKYLANDLIVTVKSWTSKDLLVTIDRDVADSFVDVFSSPTTTKSDIMQACCYASALTEYDNIRRLLDQLAREIDKL